MVFMKDVLKCLIHNVIFLRALNVDKSTEIACDFFPDIVYPKIDNPEIGRIVDEKIDQVFDGIKQYFAKTSPAKKSGSSSSTANSGEIKKTNVVLSFFIKKKESAFLFGTTEKKHEWERWFFPLEIVNFGINNNLNNNINNNNINGGLSPEEKNKFAETLGGILMMITQKVDSNRDGIPAFDTWARENGCYPFDITFSQSQDSSSVLRWFINKTPNVL